MNDRSFIWKVLRAAFVLQFVCAMPAPPAYAVNSGLDTPAGVTSLPFSVEGAEIMTLTETGLGIGTTAPQANLDVNGTIRAGPVTTGSACSPHGATGFDFSADAPVYCNVSLVWTSYKASLQEQVFTSSGTFTAPVTTTYKVTVVGGGGGGGIVYNSGTAAANGGGGGGAAIWWGTLTAGAGYSVVVGSGGASNAYSGNSEFNGSVIGYGGTPGASDAWDNSTSDYSGYLRTYQCCISGGGGGAGGGQLNMGGSSGGDGTEVSADFSGSFIGHYIGGVGGSSFMGGGGYPWWASGGAGGSYGGGGGASVAQGYGGYGASGVVLIEWVQ